MSLAASICNLQTIGLQQQFVRCFHLTPAASRVCAGRYRVTVKKNRPLTYEMANKPNQIAHRKSWNSWNTSNIKDGNRPCETAVEDVFIRRFMAGTWPELFLTEVIIKRQHNLIRISGILRQALHPQKMYFLVGYSEELLGSWLQCPIKLELQTCGDKNQVIYKYI